MKKTLIAFVCMVATAEARERSAAPARPAAERNVDAVKAALRRTLHGATPNELRERAELMDRAGFYHLGLVDRLAAVRSDSRVADLEKIGNSALALDRLDDLPTLATLAKRKGASEAALPASFRTAMAAFALRLGQVARANNWLPGNGAIGAITNSDARARAAVLASALNLAENRLPTAEESLAMIGENHNQARTGLMHLQRARLLYSESRFQDSLEELLQLPRTSASWYPGVLVGAWAAYRVRDYNLALGQLMTLHSPYLAQKFNPESYVLESATLFQLCYYESAGAYLKKLRERYGKMIASIDRFKSQHGNRFSLVSTAINYARGQNPEGESYPGDDYDLLMDGILTQEPFVNADRALQQAKHEEESLGDLFAGLPDSRFTRQLHASYARALELARREYYRTATRAGTQRLNSMRREVAEALENALAIEVEINTRVRERLITGQTARLKEVDYDTQIKKGYEFWPWQGEYWYDEAGGYAFATSDVCGDQGT